MTFQGKDWCGRPGRQSPRGGKMNILNKKLDLLHSKKNVQLLNQIVRNLINNWFLSSRLLYGAAIVIIRPWNQKQPSYATVTVYKLLQVNLSGYETT